MNILQDFYRQNRLVLKSIFIGILMLVLLIPVFLIRQLVEDRQQRHDQVLREVGSTWAGTQTISGPILVVPYVVPSHDAQGKALRDIRKAFFLPDTLSLRGTLSPERRHRGIFEVVLYRSALQLQGRFSALQPEALSVPAENWLPQEAYLMMGVSDLRGISNRPEFHWNGQALAASPGMPENNLLEEGLSVPVALTPEDLAHGAFDFSVALDLRGSESLQVVPAGRTTQVHLQSAWNNPSFGGAFLPKTYALSDMGFAADWTVLDLNRNLPQRWTGESHKLDPSAFGVSLMLPVDLYQKVTHCVKYAILVIALTFAVFFIVENAQREPVHPFSYILIGLALCVFYTLLLSLSEYLDFGLAYAIATASTAGLVALYSSWLFRQRRVSWLVGGTLLALYGFIYTLVQLQDYALLLGSLGLFAILGLLMYCTRKLRPGLQPG